MSMQINTDYGYWDPTFTENQHVVLGPGALKGCKELDRTATAQATFRWTVERLLVDPECPAVELPGGGVRQLSLMDIQNCFCEFSKYARYMRKHLDNLWASPTPYSTNHTTIEPTYPEHWIKS
jgi:hypothetical protein